MAIKNLRDRLQKMDEERRILTLKHYPRQLADEGQTDRLQELLWTFDFMHEKLNLKDRTANDLVEDLSLLPDNPWLQRIKASIQQSAHILDQDTKQIAGQLLGRLLPYYGQDDQLTELLDEVKQYNWYPALLPLFPLPSSITPVRQRTLVSSARDISAIALTPDDQFLFSASASGIVIMWDLANGSEKHHFAGHSGWKQKLVITPDGRMLINSADKEIYVSFIEIGVLRHKLNKHTGVINDLAVTADSQTLISASIDKTLNVWDLKTGAVVRTLEDHKNSVNAVVFINDDEFALSAGGSDTDPPDNNIRIWDWRSGQVIGMLVGHQHPVISLAVGRDRNQIASVAGSEIWIWDVDSGRVIDSFVERPSRIAFLPGRDEFIGINRRNLTVWDRQTGEIRSQLLGHSSPISDFTVSHNEQFAASVAGDGRIQILDLTKPGVMNESRARSDLTKHGEAIIALALTMNGRYAISSFRERTIKVWDLANGWQCVRELTGHTDDVIALAATWDQRYIVSASKDKTIRIWDITNGQNIRTLTGHNQPIRALAMTADGRYALTAAHVSAFGLEESTFIKWDLVSGEAMPIPRGHGRKATSVVIRHDGLYAFSAAGSVFASRDRGITVWDLTTGKSIGQLTGHVEPINSIALTLNGRYVISSAGETDNRDNTIKVWDLQTGQTIQTYSDHEARVNAVHTTVSGRYVVSASSDQTVRVWDIFQGRVAASFTTDHAMFACVIASNGVIIAGDDEGQVYSLQLSGLPVESPIQVPISY